MNLIHKTLLVVLINICLISLSFGQNSFYDVRFKINEYDCINSKLYIDIEVRTENPAETFFVADQNYRFSFNRDALANPVIDQELVFSGVVQTVTPPSTSFFSPHTLTGSLDTVVTYNVEMAGGEGYPLNDVDYVKVGRIRFDILDQNACVDLWFHTHDPADFPPTFLSEKVGPSLFEVEEGSYGDYAQCNNDACNNTPPVAVDDSGTTPEEVPISIVLPANDSDPDGMLDLNSIVLLSTPPLAEGAVTLDSITGEITFTPAPNFNGNVTPFDYVICDDGKSIPSILGNQNPDPQAPPLPTNDDPLLVSAPQCDTATVTIIVTPVNDPPVAVDDTGMTDEDTPIIIPVTTNDSDTEDGSPLDPCLVTVISQPANGTIAIGGPPACELTYTPDPNYNGNDSFIYQVCDSDNLCDTANVTIVVNPINDPPVAVDDSETTPEDTPVTIEVHTNDSDVEDGTPLDPCSVTILDTPANGVVTIGGPPGCELVYTPNPNYNGTDTFLYEICDSGNLCDTAIVDVTITPENDPPVAVDDAEVTDEDTPIIIPVTTNDSDTEDGSPLDPCLVTVISQPANGTIAIGGPPTCELTYTPDPNYNGNDSFIYEVCDSDNLCDTANVTIIVNPINDPPIAVDDSETTPEDTPVSIEVHQNDTDVEDVPLDSCSVTILDTPANGVVTIGGPPGCELVYTPNPNYNGTDTFLYEICDSGNLCDTAVVDVTITSENDPPVAVDDAEVTDEDTPVVILVVTNDSDVEDGSPLDPCLVTVISQPANGTIAIGGPPTCELTYTPDPNYNGNDSFIYEVCDSDNLCDTANVTIIVNPINDPPIAVDDSETTPEDAPVSIEVHQNDTDVEDVPLDSCSVTILETPANGVVTIGGPPGCELVYTPNPNYNGTDTFLYEICDSGNLCDTAVVDVTITPVNDPPIAVMDTLSTPEETAVIIPFEANDSDIEDGSPLDPCNATILEQPANGTATISGPPACEMTYTPDPGFDGLDTLVYEICDSGNLCDTTEVIINVFNVNDPPVAVDDNDTTPEDTPVTVDVTDNDTDPDNNLDPTSVVVLAPPMNGTTSVDPLTGDVTYTPNPNWNGTDTFEYQVCDLDNECDTALVTIIVDPINDPPIAVDDGGTTPEDTPITIPVPVNDSDLDGNIDPTSIIVLNGPDNGSVTTLPTGDVIYTPDADWNGTDTYEYSICDDGTPLPAMCDTAIVTIIVTPENDPPVAVDDSETTQQDVQVIIDVVGNDSDVEDGNPLDPCNVTILDAPSDGIAYISTPPTCDLIYVPNPGYYGSDTLVYEVCDSDNLCDTAVVDITITRCPEVALAINTDSLCVNAVGMFEAVDVGAGAIYNWNFGSNATPSTAFGIGPHNVSYNTIGSEQVELTILNFGCERSKTFDIGVFGFPTASISQAPTQLCINDQGLFTANLAGGTGATYTWDFGTDASPATANGPGGHAVIYNATGLKTITLTVEKNGCSDSFQQDINIIGGTQANAGPDKVICNAQSVQIGAPIIPGATYVWSPATGLSSQYAAAPIASPLATTEYVLFVTKGGCTTTDTVTVVIDVASVPFVEAGMDEAICEGDMVQIGGLPTLDPSTLGSATILWTTNGDPSTIDDNTLANPMVTPITTAIYTVCISNNGCTKCDNVTVTVNPLPDTDAGPDLTTCEGKPIIIGGNPTGASDASFSWSPITGLNDPFAINPMASPLVTTTYVVTVNRAGCTDTDTMTVTAIPCNDPPMAEDDFYETDQGTPLNVPNPNYPDGILVNDNDPENDNLSVTPDTLISTVDPSNSIILYADGSFEYTPGSVFTGTDSFDYEVCDDGSPVECDSAVIYIIVNPCVDIMVSVFLEGPFDSAAGEMTNLLNKDPSNNLYRGLLPGMTPTNPLVPPTPAGQPYNAAPWNYLGTAIENTFAGPYDPEVTDWVLVSLRTTTDPTTEIVRAAGLLYKDGTVKFVQPCLLKLGDANPPQVYIAIEHRNHMGVGSPMPIDFSNGTLTWDFRSSQSYVTGTGFGQKELLNNVYGMYAGDSDQISDIFSYDLNGNDNILWNASNGIFDNYNLGDYNLNGDVNGGDKIYWSNNNGISSRWPK